MFRGFFYFYTMMTAIRYFFFFCLLFVSLTARPQSDSLQTAKCLDSALFYPEKQSFYLGKFAKLEQRNLQNKPVPADILALRTKFELRKGNFTRNCPKFAFKK